MMPTMQESSADQIMPTVLQTAADQMMPEDENLNSYIDVRRVDFTDITENYKKMADFCAATAMLYNKRRKKSETLYNWTRKEYNQRACGDLIPLQMESVTEHLADTISIHNAHYMQPSTIIQREQVAKLLLLQHSGVEIKKKRLEDPSHSQVTF